MPNIYNARYKDAPKGSVYVGRGSLYGNPFKIGVDGTRMEVIAKFTEWVQNQPLLMANIKENLKGKDLVCYCAPLHCHAEVLQTIANEEVRDEFGSNS